jgi:hypothetical protein
MNPEKNSGPVRSLMPLGTNLPSSRSAVQKEAPGIEPSRAFAVQGLANDEIRAILKDALTRPLAKKRSR